MQNVQNLSQPYWIGTNALSFGIWPTFRSGTSSTMAPFRSGRSIRFWKRLPWAASSTRPGIWEICPVPTTKSTCGARLRISSARSCAMQPQTPMITSGREFLTDSSSPIIENALSSGFLRTEQVFSRMTWASRIDLAGSKPICCR